MSLYDVLTRAAAGVRRKSDAHRLPVLLASLCGLVLAGCGAPDYAQLGGATMGTYYSVSYRATAACQPAQAALAAELERINGLMSTYQADSELSQFNRSATLTKQPVSDDLLHVLRAAGRVHDETGGAFDVTVGPLVNLWGFGPERVSDTPAAADLSAAAARIVVARAAGVGAVERLTHADTAAGKRTRHAQSRHRPIRPFGRTMH